MQKKKGSSSSGNIFPSDKKGQGMSITTLVLIILGVVLLVVLILGFTMGWNTFMPWLPSNNVNTIVQQCGAACTTNSVYDYCSKMRTLKDENTEVETTCAVFSKASELSIYGIEECSIDCSLECSSILGKGVVEDGACPEDYDDVTSIVDVEAGQKCCLPPEAQE